MIAEKLERKRARDRVVMRDTVVEAGRAVTSADLRRLERAQAVTNARLATIIVGLMRKGAL